ncbi:hypothetical protein [Desulfomicrobium salsuginis]
MAFLAAKKLLREDALSTLEAFRHQGAAGVEIGFEMACRTSPVFGRL